MALTLKDIADKIGVAESTVSRALNDKPGVGEDTKKKIMELIDKYDFKPNQLAQGLAKQETHLLALLIPDLSNPVYPEIIKSVEKVANEKGYQVILCNTDNDIDKEKSYLNLLERDQLDGAIIVGGDLTEEYIVNTCLKEGNSIVLINRLTEEYLIPTILVDSRKGAFIAAEHLLKENGKIPAIIMGNAGDYLESEKLSGYQEALANYNCAYNPDYVVETELTREDGFQAFLQLMELQSPPRSFFVTGDILSAGLIEAVKMGGYFIPEDFQVVTYGDTLITSIINPNLTVVAEPLSEMGAVAAGNLIKLIKGESPAELIKVVEPVLKIRESSVS